MLGSIEVKQSEKIGEEGQAAAWCRHRAVLLNQQLRAQKNKSLNFFAMVNRAG